MKILYLMHEFPLISENFIIYEIDGLIKKGVDIKILSLARPPAEKMSHVPEDLGFADRITYKKPFIQNPLLRQAKLLWLLFKLLVRCRLKPFITVLKDNKTSGEYSRYMLLEIADHIRHTHEQADILFCHFGPSGRLAAILKHYGFINHKLITTFHGYDISSYVKDNPDVYKVLFEQGDLFLSVSNFFKEKAISLGAPKSKSGVVHTAIKLEDFKYNPRTLPKTGVINFTCVGRMTEKKGHEYLLKAFAKLCMNHPKRDYCLSLVGGGELASQMKEMVVELGIDQQVLFHGPLQHKDVRKVLNETHIFVLPSVTASNGDTEGIPGALMEAMAAGIPVISTYHTGVPELIDHKVTGLLCEERNANQVYDAMIYLIDNPKLWPEMLEKAHAKVGQEFERQKETNKLFDLLQKL